VSVLKEHFVVIHIFHFPSSPLDCSHDRCFDCTARGGHSGTAGGQVRRSYISELLLSIRGPGRVRSGTSITGTLWASALPPPRSPLVLWPILAYACRR
jgi:hypothetical protein